MYGSTGSDKSVAGLQTFGYEERKTVDDDDAPAGKRIAIHSYGPVDLLSPRTKGPLVHF